MRQRTIVCLIQYLAVMEYIVSQEILDTPCCQVDLPLKDLYLRLPICDC